jgi:hypothetical protein
VNSQTQPSLGLGERAETAIVELARTALTAHPDATGVLMKDRPNPPRWYEAPSHDRRRDLSRRVSLPPKIQGAPSLVPGMPLGASGSGMETEVNAPSRKVGIVPALT